MDATQRAEMAAEIDSLFDTEPAMRHVRDALLELEAWDTSDGWAPLSPRPVVYKMYLDTAAGRAATVPLVGLTALVRHFTNQYDGNAPVALHAVTTAICNPEAAAIPVPDAARAGINSVLSEGAQPTSGMSLYGVGICCQAIGIDADHPDAAELAKSGAIIDSPLSRAVWYTRLAATDSRIWDMVREQGLDDRVFVSHSPDQPMPDDGDVMTGALLRLVHAVQTHR